MVSASPFLPLAAFGLPGGAEWIIILIVILILFGGKKIPELMRGVGKGVGELQKGLDEGKRTFTDAMHHEESTPPAPAQSVPVEPNTATRVTSDVSANPPTA